MTQTSPAQAARDAGTAVKEAVTEQASEHVSEAQAGIADRIGQEADGWRAAAAQFRGDHLSKEAVGYLADHLNGAASAVRNADISSLRGEAESFARSNPLVFFGAAALVGFAIGRALKASERAEMPEADRFPEQGADLPMGVRPYPGTTGAP